MNYHIERPESGINQFKISDEVTIYEALVMMVKAWELVPRYVMMNGWRKVRILAPHEKRFINNQLCSNIELGDKPLTPSSGYVFDRDRYFISARLEAERAKGDE